MSAYWFALVFVILLTNTQAQNSSSTSGAVFQPLLQFKDNPDVNSADKFLRNLHPDPLKNAQLTNVDRTSDGTQLRLVYNSAKGGAVGIVNLPSAQSSMSQVAFS